MKINIKATAIELTPAITDYVNKKIGSVERYIEQSSSAVAQVEVGKETQHHKNGALFKAEVHLIGNGLDIYAVERQEDLYAAIDLVKDEVIDKAKHVKGKKAALGRRGAAAVKNMLKGINIFRRK